MGFKMPTAKEIVKARDMVTLMEYDRNPLDRAMKSWLGEGWHKTEVLYGILVGLQIAENRRSNERPL